MWEPKPGIFQIESHQQGRLELVDLITYVPGATTKCMVELVRPRFRNPSMARHHLRTVFRRIVKGHL